MVKPIWNNAQRVNHQNFAKKTHPCVKRNLVPRAVLMKSGLVSVNTARQVNAARSKTTVNAARPMSYLSKTAHSTIKRPIHKNTTFKNSNINQRVNTVRDKKINTARPKAVVNAVKGNNFNAVKASACWIQVSSDWAWSQETVFFTECAGTPTLSFMRPFGCPVTILNTIDHLGKCDGKADEGFFVGYSLNSNAFRVFNSRTRIVEENLHIRFSESTPNAVGSGPDWLFDIDALTRTMNYEPIVAGTQSNVFAGTKASDNADPKSSHDDGSKPLSDDGKMVDEDPRKESECNDQEKEIIIELPFDPNMHALEDYSIFNLSRDDEDDNAVADINNLDTTIQGRIDVIDADDDITLVSVHDVNVSASKEEVFEVINTAKLIIDAAQVSAAGYKVNTAGATTTVSVATITIFLSSAFAKTINGEVQLHALVNGKRIVITETSVRRTLRLEILKCLSLKTTAWNEFCSTMASVFICLATNQKFNFSKLIFDSMVRNLDNLSGEITLSSLDVVQGFSFFLQMGFTLILATLDGLDVCLLGDVISEDDCDDDG
ncbi:hypothetical protein Tco_1184024 [Tanacetum coccineum]